jgi:hypothetical protein
MRGNALSYRVDPGRDAVAFHLAFGVVCAVVLALPFSTLGWRILGAVVIYHVALPLVARWRGHREWTQTWGFLLLLSVCLVLPDMALVDVVGALRFPDLGGPRLGSVPLAMAGMWAIPLWIVIAVADRYPSRPLSGRLIWAGVAGFVLFVGSEAILPLLPLWEPVGVTTLGTVALYVVVPEVLLSVVTYLVFDLTRRKSLPVRLTAATLIPLLYLGSLVASYDFVEVVLG